MVNVDNLEEDSFPIVTRVEVKTKELKGKILPDHG